MIDGEGVEAKDAVVIETKGTRNLAHSPGEGCETMKVTREDLRCSPGALIVVGLRSPTSKIKDLSKKMARHEVHTWKGSFLFDDLERRDGTSSNKKNRRM